MKLTKVACISNILTTESCLVQARVVPNRNVDGERHCCFKIIVETKRQHLPRMSNLRSPRM